MHEILRATGFIPVAGPCIARVTIARRHKPGGALFWVFLFIGCQVAMADEGGPKYADAALQEINALLGKEANLAALGAAEKKLQDILLLLHRSRAPDAAHKRLEQTLLDVRIRKLGQMPDDEVADYSDKLKKMYSGNRKVLDALRAAWVRQAEKAVTKNDWLAAAVTLAQIDNHFVHAPETAKIRNALRQQAAKILQDAAPDDVISLRQACKIWPRLPGLGDELSGRLNKHNRVLRVAVPVLPELLSPALAVTDAEQAAVELLFESLVRPTERAYAAQLASELPAVEPLQRRFLLRRDAYWSSGERVTSSDVRHTVETFAPPAWHDFLEPPHLEQPSFHASFRLRQGLFDPLGLLCFKIVPHSFRGKPLLPADAEFSKSPVGSGPYMYIGRAAEEGRPCAVFHANPHYARSQDILPAIREMRFCPLNEKDVADVILDVPADQLEAIRKGGQHRIHTLLPERIHFLAVNHRVAALRDSNVRRALAQGIDRDAILTQHFREEGEAGSQQHRPLNGPYPPQSWACCPPPRVPAALFNEELATEGLRMAAGKLNGVTLTLKYPLYDPRTAAACAAIAGQVNKLAGAAVVKLRIECAGLNAPDFKKAIDERNFDLAYMHHDFHGHSYWLWPWFDTRPAALGKGGSNFLGHENDGKLLELLHAAAAHRQFSVMQELTHALHARLHETMPLIPLWQLHRNVAIRRDLLPAQVDPRHVFGQVEHWRFAASNRNGGF